MMTLAQAHTLLPGSRLVGDGATALLRVHSDTRSVRAGDFFVALRGDLHDAHHYLPQAQAAGAAAALVEHGLDGDNGLPGLVVQDSQQALQVLAGAWRHRMHLPLAAVTGSNGKTTVTQMVAGILRAWQGDSAFATQGNFNNHIGLPLTLLRLRQDDSQWHRVGVVELGMNHPGEVALLAALAAPTVALVNNAQREHQEFMASVQAVALENGSVINALGPAGTVVIPADDSFTALWREMAGARQVLSFVLGSGDPSPADVQGQAEWRADHWAMQIHTEHGTAVFALRMAGRHNAKNAVAAAATALALGAPLASVVQGLQAFEPVAGRSAMKRMAHADQGFTLVDDSYNANPDSVAAAIEVLASLEAPRWLILGDMGEVGAQGPAFHAEAGVQARQQGVDMLWCVGSLSRETALAFGPGARHFDTVEALLLALSQALLDVAPAASVLVKGSRFMKMERVVRALDVRAQDVRALETTAPQPVPTPGSAHAA